MYIQNNYRKPYSNRFVKGLIDLVDEHKGFNESRTHFIEDAIIEKLNRCGCYFNKPLSSEEISEWEEEVSEW